MLPMLGEAARALWARRGASQIAAPLAAASLASSSPVWAQAEEARTSSVSTARAGEPIPDIATLVRRSYQHAADNMASSAEELRSAADYRGRWMKLLPSFTASASYTRNQVEAVVRIPGPDGAVRSVVITPFDQWDATLKLGIPLVDYSLYQGSASASEVHKAAQADVVATRQDVAERVISAYYAAVGGLALEQSTVEAVGVAEENLAVVSARGDSGLASDLDVERARAAVAERQQDVASAQLTTLQGLRRLETLTGWSPRQRLAPSELRDDGGPDSPLQHWLAGVRDQPGLKAASHRVRAAEAQENVALGAYIPRLEGIAAERFTNAVGFGASPVWSIGATATWRFELGALSELASAAASTRAAHAERLRVERDIAERIANEWDQVQAEIARLRATRAQAHAARTAAQVAAARYRAGTSTQLDVLQANRDLLSSDVAHIRAIVDLARARATLRLLSTGLAAFEQSSALPSPTGVR